MKIDKLMDRIEYKVLQKGLEEEVTSLVYDSRKVTPGACFACESGLVFDGTTFLNMAREKGAVLAVMEKEPEQWPEGLTMLLVADVRLAMAQMAANFYCQALEGVQLIGMTGTNGKTTTSTLMHHVFMDNELPCGLIGTNENRIGNERRSATHTTPYPFDLYPLFDEMKQAGMQKVVMEVSSHALDQHRVENVKYQIGMFTNLSQDHLDYHQTMEAYLQAKCKLFYQSEIGLINGDDEAAETILKTKACPFVTFGLAPERDYRAENVEMDGNGLSYDWYYKEEKLGRIQYPVPGKFNVYNTLAAASACHLAGVPAEKIVESMDVQVALVPGRFQMFRGEDGVTAIVDYAHTPDGLAKVLETAAEFAKGRIITVFGCGGDRDPIKRPIMGEIGVRLSDVAIITSDNPRSEDPMAIIGDILKGIAPDAKNCEVVENRVKAIHHAMDIAKKDDIIVLAGKGHETYQEICGVKHHLDEREVVAQYLQETRE